MRRSAARQKSYSLPRRSIIVYYTLTHAPSSMIIEIILIRITIFIHNNIKLWLCIDSLWSLNDQRTASSKSSMAYRSYYYFLHRRRHRLSAPVWHGGVHRWRDSAERPRSPPSSPPPLPGRVVEPCDIPYSTQYIYVYALCYYCSYQLL